MCDGTRKEARTALGQSGFLAEFLEETGLFEQRGKRCPLDCARPDAPEGVDVPRTWRLSILDGQRRYAHVTACEGMTRGRGDRG
jgi:hypothetical protein